MIEVGDLVRPTDYACRSLDHFSKTDMGIVTEIKAEELGRRAIVYVLWIGGARRVWRRMPPIAQVWLEKVI